MKGKLLLIITLMVFAVGVTIVSVLRYNGTLSQFLATVLFFVTLYGSMAILLVPEYIRKRRKKE